MEDELITLIKSEANNNPAPTRCVITKVYEDGNHCDVKTDLGELRYVDAIGSNVQLGNNAVILYFDENYEDYVVIADTGTISPCSFDVDEENDELVFSFCGETAYEKASKKSTDLIIEDNTLENLGVIGGSNQATINRQIDLLFGRERTIDAQLSCSSSNPVENKVITNALRLKQDLLESGVNIKTINNQSLLGNGNITIEGGGSAVDIVTAWEDTPSDSKVPSEKLAKSSLDGKANTSHKHGFIEADGTVSLNNITSDIILNFACGIYAPIQQGGGTAIRVGTKLNSTVLVDGNAHSNIGTSANANQTSINTAIDTALGNKADNEDIPTNLSDLTNDMDFIEKSNTSGLIRNDGAIDTTNYSTFTGNYNDLTNKPNIPSNISDLNNDSDFIEKSSTVGLIRNDGSIDTTNYSTFDGNYNNLTNKPTIPVVPSLISAFTNDVGYLTQHQSLANYIQKSATVGLVKNDGTIDTTNYLSSLPSHNHDDRYYTEAEVDTALNGKQNTLVSGTNIKTINNQTLLGAGNINIQGGGSITVDSTWITGSTNPAESQLIQSALEDKTDVGHTHNDTEINSSYTNIERGTLILASLDDVIEYNEPFTRINRALEHMLDNWGYYD